MRVNLGCGPWPTEGWLNIDNSLTVRLARMPIASLLPGRGDFVKAVREKNIRFGTAVNTRLPAQSVSVVYSSHMLEHLDRREAKLFLAEVKRILKPDGILRLVLPDLKMLVDAYVADGDANRFMHEMCLDVDKPVSVLAKLRFAFLTGFRQHHWMYDERSLLQLLKDEGFANPVALPPGETTIEDPGALDLREREEQSIYVEARLPA